MATLAQQWKEAGLEEGLLEGDRQRAMRTARNCLKKGMSVGETAEISEMPEDHIRLLLESLKPRQQD